MTDSNLITTSTSVAVSKLFSEENPEQIYDWIREDSKFKHIEHFVLFTEEGVSQEFIDECDRIIHECGMGIISVKDVPAEDILKCVEYANSFNNDGD